MILARRCAMKGGTKGFYIDTHMLLPTVTNLRRSGFVPATPQAGLTPRLGPLQQVDKIYSRLATELRPAVQQEAALRRSWLSDMNAAFGPDARQADIVSEATELVNKLGGLGRPVSELGAARSAFQQCEYDAALAAARRLPEPGAERPGDVASAAGSVIQVSRQFARTMGNTLDQAEPDLRARVRLAGIDEDAQRTTEAELDAALSDIDQSFAEDPRADAA